MPLLPLFWDGTPPPNNGHAMGTRRPVQNKKLHKAGMRTERAEGLTKDVPKLFQDWKF